MQFIFDIKLQVKSVEPKEALRLRKENNFVILDVRPEAEFKEVSEHILEGFFSTPMCLFNHDAFFLCTSCAFYF